MLILFAAGISYARSKKSLYAVFETSLGRITCELYPDKAPLTVKNFTGLAKGSVRWIDPSNELATERPLYNDTVFHRVIPDFMIQGGDPLGNGTGGPGYRFEDEINPTLTFEKKGILAMANSGPNTNGSQFFITVAPAPWLNGRHTIFGRVV
ncbi:MAG: peptidylprolyl isomerase, partial [Candidatus Margulisiibacteriota bacterium]